ncbi:MAG: tetratricopeptide repeat protein, partial [Spirochaetales bacterium]|nr:tetratricopeptide repeat protein [Spirochaetales bacterium]
MKKKIIAIVCGVLLVAAAVGATLYFTKHNGNSQSSLSENKLGQSENNKVRDNTLILARDYMEKGDYARSLDLLDGLLIQDASDQEVKKLREEVISARKNAESEAALKDKAQQDDLVETLEELGENMKQQPSANQANSAEAEMERLKAAKELAELQKQQLEAEERRAERRRAEEEKKAEEERKAAEQKKVEDKKKAEEARKEEEKRKAEEEKRNKEVRELIEKGLALMEKMNYDGARKAFDSAIEVDPEAAEPYAQKGETFFQEDKTNQVNLREAVEYANKSLDRDDTLWVPHNTLGKIYVETKNYPEAIKEFKEAARLNPEDGSILYELGVAQYKAGKYNDSKLSFEGAIHQNAENYKAYYNLGMSLVRLGKINEAIQAFKNAADKDPSYDAAFFAAGNLLYKTGKYAEAEKYLKNAVALKPEKSTYLGVLGVVLLNQEKYKDAEKYLKQSLSANPDAPSTNYNLSHAYFEQGNYSDALTYAVKAVQLDSDNSVY